MINDIVNKMSNDIAKQYDDMIIDEALRLGLITQTKEEFNNLPMFEKVKIFEEIALEWMVSEHVIKEEWTNVDGNLSWHKTVVYRLIENTEENIQRELLNARIFNDR